MTSKQYITLLPEKKTELINKMLANEIVLEKLKEANITEEQLKSKTVYFANKKPTRDNRKHIFGVVGEWNDMKKGRGVWAYWTILNDIIFVFAMLDTGAFAELKAKTGNQKDAIQKAGKEYRKLFKYYTGHESGRSDSSLQNAGLPYALIAKQITQGSNLKEQLSLLNQTESQLHDTESKFADTQEELSNVRQTKEENDKKMKEIEEEYARLSLKNQQLANQINKLETQEKNELSKYGEMIERLVTRVDNLEQENMENKTKRKEAEDAAAFFQQEANKVQKINSVCAHYDAARIVNEKQKIEHIMSMEGGKEYYEQVKTNMSLMHKTSNLIESNTNLSITTTE